MTAPSATDVTWAPIEGEERKWHELHHFRIRDGEVVELVQFAPASGTRRRSRGTGSRHRWCARDDG